ncbi:MAG: 3-phenylpropionate/trans-cinnamate dioxygenase ferredoxin reductase subunit [Dinoroseobacter sp.]|jgi:3-phenylpropionate/trans-cinnamate dioxygenase ferredoxin reductase subunit
MTSIVIVGASHAAAEIISSLKKKGFAGSITLIGDESLLPYQRPPLSKKYFTGELKLDHMYIKGPATYAAAGVIQKLGRTVVSIDRQGKTVKLDGGELIAYDKLVLATGTRARKLPVEGADLPQIKYLRTKEDVDDIKLAIKPNSKLLIVGAGYIGLEVAASAVKQGVEVVVLEAMDRVLQRVTSPTVSEFFQRVHIQEGVDIRLNASLKSFQAKGTGATALIEHGDAIDFDCAIIGIGVIPNSEIAYAAGLTCDNGILVDEFTKTDDPNIYAVGDCSNHPSFVYDRRIRLESVPNAMGQAKTAAASICGEDMAYDEVPWFWSDQYDIKLQTVGLCQGHDQIVVRGQSNERKMAVFYLQEGRLIAVDAINSPAEFMVSKKLVAMRSKPDPEQLADPSVSMKSFL